MSPETPRSSAWLLLNASISTPISPRASSTSGPTRATAALRFSTLTSGAAIATSRLESTTESAGR